MYSLGDWSQGTLGGDWIVHGTVLSSCIVSSPEAVAVRTVRDFALMLPDLKVSCLWGCDRHRRICLEFSFWSLDPQL